MKTKTLQSPPPFTTADPLFPIVGIGASTVGLAAFQAFFSGMPPDKEPCMAFVLGQHLAPDHKSILTDLIRRYTSMQVFEVIPCAGFCFCAGGMNHVN
jgi:two-component system CheB/CheR fusion protein